VRLRAIALARGIAEASQSGDSVSGNGSLDVTRYGRLLKARQLVGVRGAGIAFDGLYFVSSVTTSIKRGELKQSFELTRNGIVVVIIVNFVTAWGEYLLGVTLTNDQEVRTLPVVLAGAFGGMGQWAWPRIAAVYVMAIAPGLAAFALTQRWYMRGLQEGALKY